MVPCLIVPVLNRYDLLDRMLHSIDYPVGMVLIVDNGGAYHTQADLLNENIQKLHVLNLPSNLGVAASWNLGIKLLPHEERWFFASNDMTFGPGALETLSEARRDEITLSDMFPRWHTFCVGDEALSKLGLFDEALYPAYYEDTDMERRATHFGVTIRALPIATTHENSSTINSDYNLRGKNHTTFSNNSSYYTNKVAREDYGQGTWSLERRRANAWDTPR
jgi:GT2 family glycosyltransferase